MSFDLPPPLPKKKPTPANPPSSGKPQSDTFMVYVDGSSLGNPGPSGYCAFIIWPDGRRQTVADREEWLERTAQRHADTMAKTFGGALTGNPEVAARALAIHFGRRLEPVARELVPYLPEEIEGDY